MKSKPRRHIPVSSETVRDCRKCTAACCRGGMVMDLTLKEVALMSRAGNLFVTVEPAKPFAREKVIRPQGAVIDSVTGKHQFLVKCGDEFAPLPVNFGRFILQNDCKYLTTTEMGWQQCGIYTDRPVACVAFEVGSLSCQDMQSVRNTDPILLDVMMGQTPDGSFLGGELILWEGPAAVI